MSNASVKQEIANKIDPKSLGQPHDPLQVFYSIIGTINMTLPEKYELVITMN